MQRCGGNFSQQFCSPSVAAAAFPLPAYAQPVGGQVSTGTGAIAQAGTNTTITQSSQNLAINWQSFSIGSNEAVQFIQPNASSIALNRVLGQDPSFHTRQPHRQRPGVCAESQRRIVRHDRPSECRRTGRLDTEPERCRFHGRQLQFQQFRHGRDCRQPGHPRGSRWRLHRAARTAGEQSGHHHRHAGNRAAGRRRQGHPESQQWFAAVLQHRPGFAQCAGRERSADPGGWRAGIHDGQGRRCAQHCGGQQHRHHRGAQHAECGRRHPPRRR